jgi:hypothetical protein
MSKFLIIVITLFIAGIAKLNAQCQISGNLIDSGKEAVAYGNILIEGVDSQIKPSSITTDKLVESRFRIKPKN